MPSLKDFSVALGLLASDIDPGTQPDGWKDYVWRIRSTAQCRSASEGFCQLVEDKWDWKRPQQYRFWFQFEPSTATVTARITFQNDDRTDDDQVCLVASFLNDAGDQIGILYVNWLSLPQTTYTRDVPIKLSRPAKSIKTVVVGSKQCREEQPGDEANYKRIRARLGQKQW